LAMCHDLIAKMVLAMCHDIIEKMSLALWHAIIIKMVYPVPRPLQRMCFAASIATSLRKEGFPGTEHQRDGLSGVHK
jgi:hypothetical protein